MPTRGRPARSAGGFSLLELLVTLFVIVLVTSLVTLNVGSGGRDLELETRMRDLAEGAAFALDEAQLLGRDFGLLLEQRQVGGEWVHGWRWRERRPEGWREPADGREIFAPVRLPAEVELVLELEALPGREADPGGTDERTAAPQVVLYASGETTEGAIELRSRDGGDLLWRLEWDLLGRFRLLRRGEEDDEGEG